MQSYLQKQIRKRRGSKDIHCHETKLKRKPSRVFHKMGKKLNKEFKRRHFDSNVRPTKSYADECRVKEIKEKLVEKEFRKFSS